MIIVTFEAMRNGFLCISTRKSNSQSVQDKIKPHYLGGTFITTRKKKKKEKVSEIYLH